MRLAIEILEMERQAIDSSWDTADVYSAFWRVYVNGEWGASMVMGDGVHEIGPGAMHVVPAWVRFTCRCEAGRRIDHRYIHFALDGLPTVMSRRVFDRPFAWPSVGLPRSAWSSDEGPSLTEAVRRSAGLAWCHAAVAGAFERLSVEAWATCEPFLRGGHRFAQVLDRIEQRLGEPMHNAELAKLAHLSEGQFIRRFKAELGQTPAQYIRERRVIAAAQRLRGGDESIESIAAACGFGDRHYFTRTFTQVIGVPPATYRQRNRV